MFLKDCWYVAAWSSEIGREPLARTLLDQPVALYRGEDGTAIALADRCCHRAMPLSMGKVVGDRLQCSYHGLQFAPDGACVVVPGQSQVPPGAAVRSYTLVERAGWVWIWMGDPALADEALLPDWWWMDHPEWKTVPGNFATPLYSRCNYQMIIENLLDLSHLTFVHTDTIGNDEITRFPCRTERQSDGVCMTRMMPEVEPAPFYKMAGGFTGAVDRWQVVDARLPVYVDVDVGCAELGRGALDGKRNQGIGRGAHLPRAQLPDPGDRDHDPSLLCPCAAVPDRRPGDGRGVPHRFRAGLPRGPGDHGGAAAHGRRDAGCPGGRYQFRCAGTDDARTARGAHCRPRANGDHP